MLSVPLCMISMLGDIVQPGVSPLLHLFFCYSYVMLLIRIIFFFSTVTSPPLKEGGCRVKWYVSFNYVLPEVDVGESGYGVVNKDESS